MKRIGFNFSIAIIIQIFFLASNLIYAGSKKDSSSKIDIDNAYHTAKGDIVLAKVGNKKISVREFLSSYEFGPAFTKREKDSKQKYLKYMIDEKLLAMEGYTQGYGDSSRVKELLSAIEGDLASNQMFYKDIFNKIKISNTEIDQALAEKQITYNIKWLFAPDKDSLNYYLVSLKNNISFDSLFNEQLKDSVKIDQRSLHMDKFKMRMRNPEMLNVVDSLKVGEVSSPIHGPDGWYIVKLIDVWKNVITTQTEIEKEKADAENSLKLNKSDEQSDLYVRTLMLEHNPVIQGKAFDILRSYMGNFVLPKNKFDSWKLDDRMKKELKNLDTLSRDQFGKMTLVKLNNNNLSLDDFLNWYKLRDEYLKFDETSFNNFSASLEKLIWQMVRDHLLVSSAYSRGFQNLPIVQQQVNWWEDKIVYAVVRDNLANTVGLNIELPTSVKNKNNDKKQELMEKIFRKLQQLKKKYKVQINEKVLDEIEVQDSNNPRAIDFYFVKKGGTFPHPAYPSIDYSWQSWE
ncbi:MAG: peptidylprolyl isomerase [Bacteroidetes bacterium]|nr:peptidylprolyl isomerase [Bacteroidota bacterium]